MRGLVVDEERCFGCRACTTACGPSRIRLWEDNGLRHIRFPGTCEEDCVRCREVCPREAISFAEVDGERPERELLFVLQACSRCGRLFAPEKALAVLLPQIRGALGEAESPWVSLCPSCRQAETARGLALV